MVIVKLMGGLGNQMFQYAAAKALAERRHTSLKLDTSSYSTDDQRMYELDCFEIDAEIATEDEIRYFADRTGFAKVKYQIKRLVAGAPQLIVESGFSFTTASLVPAGNKSVGGYDPKVLRKKTSTYTYIVGFWQSWKYAESIASQLRNEFTFKNPLSKKNEKYLRQINNATSVSLHVRRSDYVSNPVFAQVHGSLSLEYYQRAVEYIADRIKDPTFFVVSDDTEWCKKNIKLKYPTIFIDTTTADKNFEDMRLISSCEHNIIANSSFSWWGAWLNNNQEKIVVAPKHWYKDPGFDTSDTTPPSWVRL